VAQVSLQGISQEMNRCDIGAYSTGRKKEYHISAISKEFTSNHSCRAKLDSHADTCGVNNVAYIIEYLGQVAEVYGFSKSMNAMQDVPIVKAAVAYDDHITGETLILVINQALYFGSQLSHILLNQNQMRAHGLTVKDCPKHLLKGKSKHAIILEEKDYEIPLKLHGIMSYFDVLTPTKQELLNCIHVDITSPTIKWVPYSSTFEEEETKLNNAHILQPKIYAYKSFNIEHDDFSDTVLCKVASTTTSKKQLHDKSEDLAKRWMVGLTVALNMIKATTQSFVRNAVHPIERRFRSKMATLQYNHLKCRFYSDTLFSSKKSILNNQCGQLFVTNFGYVKFVPMQLKSEASEALHEVIRDVGIPEQVHTDGAKDLTMGKWRKLCNEYGVKMTQTEKGSPWQNRAEIEIRELKRHTRRMMHVTKTPHKLWDLCMLYVSDLRNRLIRPLPNSHGRTAY
jgi:hypothetical protein